MGSQDHRHGVFTETLRTAYLRDVKRLVLECTPQAQHDSGLRRELDCFASLVGFAIRETTLALSHQWPRRRRRWLVVLCPHSWGVKTGFSHGLAVRIMRPLAPVFQSGDRGLILTKRRFNFLCLKSPKYGNPVCGSDKRILELSDMAPTFLHSYGNAPSACPRERRPVPLFKPYFRRTPS